jgi:hypothetical protein
LLKKSRLTAPASYRRRAWLLCPVDREAAENRRICERGAIGRWAELQDAPNKLGIPAEQAGAGATGEAAIGSGVALLIVRLCPVGRIAAAVADGGGIKCRVIEAPMAGPKAVAGADRNGEEQSDKAAQCAAAGQCS